MTHAFFANMGGSSIDFDGDPGTNASSGEKSSELSSIGHVSTQSTTKNSAATEAIAEEKPKGHLVCAAQLAILRRHYHLWHPSLTKEDLQDRSKASALIKALACIQAGWLVVQCFARIGQRLAITQLELATTGFVGCTLATFLFWWSKPLDVEHRYTISCPSELRHDVRQLLDGLDISDYSESIRTAIRKKGRMPFLQFMDPEGRTTSEAADLISGSFAVAGTTFSAVHVAGWNFAFPSQAEKLLWRICSVVSTTMCLLIYYSVRRRIRLSQRAPLALTDFLASVTTASTIVYILARFVLIGQICLCLRSMPPDVYDTVDWTSFIPRVS